MTWVYSTLYTGISMSDNPFTLLPDPELIEACLNGKNEAWEALLIRYQRLIYSIPLRYGMATHEANDVFQNVSVLLLENLRLLRNRQRLGSWLIITTRRECWRMTRQMKQTAYTRDETQLEDQAVEAAPGEEELVALERQSILRSAVAVLENPCQKLLQLLFFEEPRNSYESVARKLRISAGSIGPTRARCLEKLMKILEAMGFAEL